MKRAGQYHHGDLRRALIDQALRTIDSDGVAGLTLRGAIRTTMLRGEIIYEDGTVRPHPSGRLIGTGDERDHDTRA